MGVWEEWDHNGAFLAGFSYRKNFVSSPLHIELLALKDGIQMFQALEVSHAIVNSDYLIAIQALNTIEEDLSSYGNLIEDIKNM